MRVHFLRKVTAAGVSTLLLFAGAFFAFSLSTPLGIAMGTAVVREVELLQATRSPAFLEERPLGVVTLPAGKVLKLVGLANDQFIVTDGAMSYRVAPAATDYNERLLLKRLGYFEPGEFAVALMPSSGAPKEFPTVVLYPDAAAAASSAEPPALSSIGGPLDSTAPEIAPTRRFFGTVHQRPYSPSVWWAYPSPSYGWWGFPSSGYSSQCLPQPCQPSPPVASGIGVRIVISP